MANRYVGTLHERLFSQLVPDASGCLLWVGRTRAGYGQLSVNGKTQQVHRLVYEMWVGLIPDGLQLDHLCRVRNCANVDHLEPVTAWVNTMRGEAPTAVKAGKTHCPAGHAYDLKNTYWYRDKRHCRPCHREREVARRRAEKRQAAA